MWWCRSSRANLYDRQTDVAPMVQCYSYTRVFRRRMAVTGQRLLKRTQSAWRAAAATPSHFYNIFRLRDCWGDDVSVGKWFPLTDPHHASVWQEILHVKDPHQHSRARFSVQIDKMAITMHSVFGPWTRSKGNRNRITDNNLQQQLQRFSGVPVIIMVPSSLTVDI